MLCFHDYFLLILRPTEFKAAKFLWEIRIICKKWRLGGGGGGTYKVLAKTSVFCMKCSNYISLAYFGKGGHVVDVEWKLMIVGSFFRILFTDF